MGKPFGEEPWDSAEAAKTGETKGEIINGGFHKWGTQ